LGTERARRRKSGIQGRSFQDSSETLLPYGSLQGKEQLRVQRSAQAA
jgi:hypothetical protein